MKKNVRNLISIFFFCGAHASSNNSEKPTAKNKLPLYQVILENNFMKTGAKEAATELTAEIENHSKTTEVKERRIFGKKNKYSSI